MTAMVRIVWMRRGRVQNVIFSKSDRQEYSGLTPQAYTLTPATNITITRQSVYRIGKFVMGTVLFKSSVANPTNLLYLAHIADGRMDLPYYNLDTFNIRGIATISAGYSGIFRNTGAIDANTDYCINIMAVLR